MGRGFGKDGGDEAVTVDSHEPAMAGLCIQSRESAATPIRAIVPTTTIGKEKTRGWAACFSKINY
jgi:hypothetical protein